MRGLDTNVLARYLVQDDPVQGERASQLIEEMAASGTACFINNIVLCELVWVLKSAYAYKKEDIISILDRLLNSSQFEFESKEAAKWALEEYQKSKADFSDCLLAKHNQNQGCSETISFDKGVRRVEGFRVL
ncbi:MAG: type II toxin-antitoxin system VapC family toxin [Oscillatoria sp. SIO1A7]|nr:type II toxin-antitoxin system VapC family toxin [Oscillatoria sp. SIO1A7]